MGVDREKGGQIYAILEVNGKLKPVPSDKHESYPKALKSEGGVKINILTDRVNWSDVTEDFQTNEIVSKDRRNRIYPTSGVSVRGLKINTSNISKSNAPESREQQDAPQSRKQKPNYKLAKINTPNTTINVVEGAGPDSFEIATKDYKATEGVEGLYNNWFC